MIARLIVIEVRRLLGRGLVRALLALPVLPVVVAAILRGRYAGVFQALRSLGARTDELWLVTLGATSVKGFSSALGQAAMAISGVTLSNVASFAWLIAVLFAVYLYASDTSSGRLALLLVRPVSRTRVVLGKLAAGLIVLSILYTEAALAGYAAMSVMAGWQSMPWLIIVYGLAMSAASIPMLLVTGLVGLRTGKGGTTLAAGLVIYFVLAIASSIAAVPYMVSGREAEAARIVAYTNAAEAIHSFILPRLLLDAAASGLKAPYSSGIAVTGISIGSILLVAAVSLTIYSMALIILLVSYIKRLDLKIP